MQRFAKAAVVTLVAVAGLAACSSDDDDATPSGGAPSAVPIGTETPTTGPSPSAGASDGAVPAGKSRLDILVNDCEGCVLTAYVPLVKGEELRTWVSDPVVDGRTSLVVPTAATASMSFDVAGTEELDLTFVNARPAVVLAYRTPTGGTQEGNWCWAGTTESVVSLTIRHRRIPADQFPGAERTDDHEDLFEAQPALPVVEGEWQPSEHGGLGHQDAPYCSAAQR